MRSSSWFIVGLGVLGALIGVIYWGTLGAPELASIPEPSAASLPAAALVVAEASGEVTRVVAGAARPLVRGDLLRENDEIRTAGNAQAVVDTEDGKARIRIGPESALSVSALSRQLARVFLSSGSLAAESTGFPLEFSASGTQGRVELDAGAARLLADGKNGFVVGATGGSVQVRGGGETMLLGAGEATRIVGSGRPEPRWKIPASLLLKVQWPKESDLAVRRMQVGGKASPGALVRVRGLSSFAAKDGTFMVDVPLAEGINTVELSAEDPAGRREHSRFKVRVDTTPAEVGVETSPELWKKRR